MMKIGALADATGTQVETIRYYEREGLLPEAARSEGNFRLYGPAHAERLRFIRCCRGLDMSLGEVRVLLQFRDAPDSDCGDVNALLDAHIGHVGRRIKELRSLERQLKTLRQRCDTARDAAHCGILSGIAGAATPVVAPSPSTACRAGPVRGPRPARRRT